MPRIMIKGVIWNKMQDDILKAGVLRYGSNQWERIIPLLPGKTVRQCKDRWEIGLSQSVRKTQWTRTEDDKLLRLVILMPAKWQNIASIIGRTAADCFNRYDCLLTRAQEQQRDVDEVVDPRKLVPGRVYRNPRIKPAFVNVTNTLEDGLEVLMSEARAKLASAQARKAKLLAREKRLEVARRFAYVRRQRERMRARARAEEMAARMRNLEVENSSDSHSASFLCYSSTGDVDPLAEIFLQMQHRQQADVELRNGGEVAERPNDQIIKRPAESSVLDEQTLKRRQEIAESVAMFLRDEEPPTKRRKVIVLHEPIAYEDLQQVVELRRRLESSSHFTAGRYFADSIAQECCLGIRETGIRECKSNENSSHAESSNFCIQSVG